MAQFKDELASVGKTVSGSELVRIALKGFTKKWEVFVKCIVGREKHLDWSRLWDELLKKKFERDLWVV